METIELYIFSMKEKNRFSTLLEHLLSMANIKNYTLANFLQYDESYISKWTSGKLLPTEKNYDKILHSISHCIIESLTEETSHLFFQEYQLNNKNDLEKAIFDNLEMEYNYVKDLKFTTGSELPAKIAYYPELTLFQFVSKMIHPSLRKVKELDVCAVIDILNLDTDYQLMIADINTNHSEKNIIFPGVSFSMFINLDTHQMKDTYTAAFLMNLLANLSNINFHLYGGKQALGKIVFTVRDTYSISGMLIDNSHCISVTTSEDPNICNPLYKKLKMLCNKESLLIRKSSIAEMIINHEYEQFAFSSNQRWILGHPTEHFLPEELHQELLDSYINEESEKGITKSKLSQIHLLTTKIIESTKLQIMVYDSAFSAFIVTGTLDFYGKRIQLTPRQRLLYMKHLFHLLDKKYSISLKVIRGKLHSDFQHIPNPTLFLSDTFSYLRLKKNAPTYNICISNKYAINDIFKIFFDNSWNDPISYKIENSDTALEIITHAIHTLEIMSNSI